MRQRSSVLVVEDEAMIAFDMSGKLTSLGARVAIAARCDEAADYLAMPDNGDELSLIGPGRRA